MRFEYEYMGQKVALEPDEDVVAVRYKEPATPIAHGRQSPQGPGLGRSAIATR
jgi:hypothetical protein